MIRHYYYNQQLKKAAIVFANIFAGMVVRTGLNECGETTDIKVPVRYGSTDRVASAIGAANTQNKLHTLPMMSVYLNGIEMAPDRQHGIGHLDRRTFLEQGGIYPNDVKAIQRLMPVPYDLTYELAIYASNTDQVYQILEQILILFDYDLQVQMDDAVFNWAKITRVSLEGITNEEQYPSGTDRRIIVWTLSFKFETWFSLPMELRTDIINQINVAVGSPDAYVIEEYDEHGELKPFAPSGNYGTFQIAPKPEPATDAQPGLVSRTLDELGIPTHYDASLDQGCHVQPRNNGEVPL